MTTTVPNAQTQKRDIGAGSPDVPNADAQSERDHSTEPNGAQALPFSHPLKDNNSSNGQSFNMTPTRARALYWLRRQGIKFPGQFHAAQNGHGRALGELARKGLVERKYETRPRRMKRPYRKAMYRLADQGRRITPMPEFPPLQGPHMARRLGKAERHIISGYLNWTIGVERVVFVGVQVTAWARPTTSNLYSLESYAGDLYAYIRLRFPESVIEDTRLYKRRGRSWVSLTFHLAGEPLPLLPAGPMPLLLPAPKEEMITCEGAVRRETGNAQPTGPQWTPEPASANDNEHAAIWRGLCPEARAILALLYANPGWQLMNRWGDAQIERALHQLDMELLIFRNRAGEARISSRGVELIEEYAALEVASWG